MKLDLHDVKLDALICETDYQHVSEWHQALTVVDIREEDMASEEKQADEDGWEVHCRMYWLPHLRELQYLQLGLSISCYSGRSWNQCQHESTDLGIYFIGYSHQL